MIPFISTEIAKKFKLLESFSDSDSKSKSKSEINEYMNIYVIIWFILNILISVYAFYLSYNCKSQSGQLSQILFSIGAFIFGFLYLIYYFFVNYLPGQC